MSRLSYQQILQGAHVEGSTKLLVTQVAGVGPVGSRLSKEQILADCRDAQGRLRIVLVPGVGSSDVEPLSEDQYYQKVHDVGARALRVIAGTV